MPGDLVTVAYDVAPFFTEHKLRLLRRRHAVRCDCLVSAMADIVRFALDHSGQDDVALSYLEGHTRTPTIRYTPGFGE